MNFLIAILIFFMTMALQPTECVCIKEPHRSEERVKADRRQSFEKATAVFTGKVVAANGYKVTFKLRKRWKGETSDEITLSTGAVTGVDGAPVPEECSYQFQLGEEYLVYTYGPPTEMKASVCLTLATRKAAEEEAGLDEIKLHEVIREKSN